MVSTALTMLNSFINSGSTSGRCFLLVDKDINHGVQTATSFVCKLLADEKSSQSVRAGTSPDVLFISNAEKNIVVKDIEPIIERANQTAVSLKGKAFIISDASRLSTICQNKLLKTIEDASADTVFVFIASSLTGILATVKSRSAIVFEWGGQSNEDASLASIVKMGFHGEILSAVKNLEKVPLEKINSAVIACLDGFSNEKKCAIIRLLDEVNKRIASNCNVVNTLDWFFLEAK